MASFCAETNFIGRLKGCSLGPNGRVMALIIQFAAAGPEAPPSGRFNRPIKTEPPAGRNSAANHGHNGRIHYSKAPS